MRWFWSGDAIQAHLLFLVAIAILSTELIAGNQRPAGDYLLGLIFCAVAYPVVLLLIWVRWRYDRRIVETPSAGTESHCDPYN